MAVTLSSDELDRTIEVLSSAGQTLRLTWFERLSYRALLVSVDVFLVSCVVLIFLGVVSDPHGTGVAREAGEFLIGMLGVVVASAMIGTFALALNIPLLFKTFREASKLKRLGLDSLSISLWKESRRSRWMSRIRGVLLIGLGILTLAVVASSLGAALIGKNTVGEYIFLVLVALFYAIIAAVLFGARYLRNQRERMDLAASAEELSKALVSLRQRQGSEGVSVPAELLERSARIESAQITRERKDAVLQSATFRPNAYAVAFNREAALERSTLGVADRVELEDLVAELSTDGAQLQAQTQPEASPGRLLRTTKSKGVEIEVVIDRASRGIRVTAVRHAGEASAASLNGAGNA
jgi:hypothetical protein